MKTIKELEQMTNEQIDGLSEEEKIMAQSQMRIAIRKHFSNPLAVYEACPFKMSLEQYKQLEQIFAPLRFLKDKKPVKAKKKADK